MNDEEEWRAYLLGTHPKIRRGRGLFGHLPSEPRCKLCYAPFRGAGSLLTRPLGFTPWDRNPNVCRRCLAALSKRTMSGAEIELTMLFADIRGSTSLAEGISGTAFSTILNRFYETASAVLTENDAVIDKFVGDGVIGLFIPGMTGDDHAAHAVEAARQILVRTGHADPDGPWVPLGIGLHTGVARVGMVGTPGGLMDFTALGDSMNTAARLASEAGPGEILVSDAACAAAHMTPDDHEHRDLHLKGRTEPVGAHVLTVGVPTMVGQA